jgi:hypothetical protein
MVFIREDCITVLPQSNFFLEINQPVYLFTVIKDKNRKRAIEV